ncbi:YlzJ-like family protein [Paenibacillus dakarensis]|uniref:YlzJ-like family protein n=1 Tax=Paenibacillus dakarensis TaxID=1527293 RepID=UPI0006D56FB5|nr:YlzJ-like family protein [Paenibacillus dakarensis]
MTLYTVIPEDMIWSNDNREQEPSHTVEIQIGGILMQVEPMQDHKAKIVRLLNGELGDYLNPLYTPGNTISFVPVMDQNSSKV